MSPKRSASLARRVATFVGMVAFSGGIGLGVGLLGALIGSNVLGDDFAGFGELVGALTGMVIGYPVGVITGILVLNKRFHYDGTLWRGILGSIVGAAATMGLAEPLNLNLNTDLLFTLFFLLPPLLGIIGFRSKSKKHK